MEGLAVMTSGGDAAGMNPAVKCVVDYARKKGYKPYIIRNGLRGMIDNDISEASYKDVSSVLHRGGTLFRSSRSKRFFEYKYREQAYENLKKHGITKLVVIGGDGSFNALNRFYLDFGVPFAGIPATIDNDIPGTDYCLGVDTALNVIRQSIDSIRDTAQSFSRAFVIETMGRDCGYLAMTSALASGAEICIVPELEYDLESIKERLLNDIKTGRREYIIAVVAEGSGRAEEMIEWFNNSLKMDARLTVLGHVQRGGSPTVRDRIMAYKFAVSAVDALDAGHTDYITTYKEGAFGYKTIAEVVDSKVEIDPLLLELCKPLCH